MIHDIGVLTPNCCSKIYNNIIIVGICIVISYTYT